MKRRFKVTSIINLTNIILVLSSTIVSSIFYISASEGIKNKLIKSLNTQNEQYSSSLESLFVQLLEISSKISNHNEVKLLKSYYFDKKGDNFGKVEALNTLDDNLDTFNFLSSYVYTVAFALTDRDSREATSSPSFYALYQVQAGTNPSVP